MDKFYDNWGKYKKELVLEIDYPNFYKDVDTQKKIQTFLDINNENFLKNFPGFQKYNKNKNFVDPSSTLMRKIHNFK